MKDTSNFEYLRSQLAMVAACGGVDLRAALESGDPGDGPEAAYSRRIKHEQEINDSIWSWKLQPRQGRRPGMI